MRLGRRSRWFAIAAFIAASLLAGSAAAERVKAKGRTALRTRPGEQARIVVRVDAGTPLEVVERKGRWLKVRGEAGQGWVTRTTVETAAPKGGDRAEAKRRRRNRGDRNARRDRGRKNRDDGDKERRRRAEREDERSSWGGRNTAGGAMKVEVAVEEASAFATPDAGSEVRFTASKGDRLSVLSTENGGRWFLVAGPDGERGWLPDSSLDDPGSLTQARPSAGEAGSSSAGSAASSSEPGADVSASAPDPEDPDGGLRLSAGAGAGFGLVGLDYGDASADGTGAGLRLTGDLAYPVTDTLFVGADLSYLALQGFGLSYDAGGGESSDIGFRVFDLDLAARAGYVADPVRVWLRAGLFYNALFVTDIAELPREEAFGPAAGVAIDYAITDALSASAAVSLMFGGTRRQTEGLEDGAEVASARALRGRAGISYQLSPTYAASASYQYLSMATEWTGASSRVPGQMNTSRDDLAHIVSLGVGAAF